jgi:phenylacetate-CoA ligase
MSDYEELRRRHMADATALAPRLIEQLAWSAERLASHRVTRLRELVQVAVERSPWHHKRLGGLNPGALDEAALGELPVMTKGDLIEHFDDIVTDDRLRLDVVNDHLDGLTTGRNGYLFDRYTAIASSGSTGRRGTFVYDWDGWATFYLGLFRYLLRAIDTDPKLKSAPVVMASVAASHPTHATAAFGRTFSGPQLVSRRFPVTMPTEQIVAGLNEAQPTFLQGYASALHLLTHEAKAGRLRIAPRRIITGAEPLLPEIRSALEETWDVHVGSWWGTSEGGATGAPCDLAETHLSEDLLIVEPVDESGRAVAPGKRSAKIYLTNLYNHTLPLIRYEITDEVTVLEEPCPCGSAHRRIADIQGRLDDTFVYQGTPVHPHVFRSRLGQEHNVVEYQVRQTERGAAVALRCAGPVALELLRNAIVDDLKRLSLPQPDVTITVVDAIDRQCTGKLKRFVPLSSGVLCIRERSLPE